MSANGKKSLQKCSSGIETTAQVVDACVFQGETGTMSPNVPIVLFDEDFYPVCILTSYNVIPSTIFVWVYLMDVYTRVDSFFSSEKCS